MITDHQQWQLLNRARSPTGSERNQTQIVLCCRSLYLRASGLSWRHSTVLEAVGFCHLAGGHELHRGWSDQKTSALIIAFGLLSVTYGQLNTIPTLLYHSLHSIVSDKASSNKRTTWAVANWHLKCLAYHRLNYTFTRHSHGAQEHRVLARFNKYLATARKLYTHKNGRHSYTARDLHRPNLH